MTARVGRWARNLSGALALGGCSNLAVMQGAVRTQAVGDLSCPVEQVEVMQLRVQVWSAEGCERAATYTVRGECTKVDNCTARLNPESVRPGP